MGVTQSTHGAVWNADGTGQVLEGRRWKWIRWNLSSATVGTDALVMKEKDNSGFVVVNEIAEKANGAQWVPTPYHDVDNLYVSTLGNGTVDAAPIE